MKTRVKHNWTQEEDALLGKVSDGEAARQIGLAPLTILLRRRELGIAAYKPQRRIKTWGAVELLLFQTHSDAEIAKLAKRDANEVMAMRRKLMERNAGSKGAVI